VSRELLAARNPAHELRARYAVRQYECRPSGSATELGSPVGWVSNLALNCSGYQSLSKARCFPGGERTYDDLRN